MQSKTALMILVAFFATVCTLLAGFGIGFELCSDRPNITTAAVVVASMAIAAWGFLLSLWERPAPAVAEVQVVEEVAPTTSSPDDAWFQAYRADQARCAAAWEQRMRDDQARSDKWWAETQAANAKIEEEWKKRNGF